jgi:hypothetical protein
LECGVILLVVSFLTSLKIIHAMDEVSNIKPTTGRGLMELNKPTPTEVSDATPI